MKCEDLKVGEAISFHEFCVNELQIHSALAPWAVDHTWQFQQKRIDELEAKQQNNGWISVDEPPVVSVGGMKEFNVVTRDQLGHQTVESAWYLNQYPLFSEDGEVLDGYDDEGYRPETGWYKCLGRLDEELYFRLHTVTHYRPLPPAPEQPK